LASGQQARSVARHESWGFDWGDALKIIRKSWAWVASAWAVMQTSAASAQALADPAGSGALVNAVRWLQGTLLGTVATVVAVIAVASVGFLMLTGRINWRYGATVIIGCFILFGAASIVAGIQSTAAVGN
jgi:type IV secretion system protein VirB2